MSVRGRTLMKKTPPSGSLEYFKPLTVGPRSEDVTARGLLSQTDSGEFCDLRLVYNGQHLWAHSSILQCKSEYFDLLLNNKSFGPVDKNNIDMSDIFRSNATAKTVHQFFYLSTITITATNAFDVLHSATVLFMGDLLSIVEDFLINNLIDANTWQFYLVAKRYHLTNLSALLNRIPVLPAADLLKSPELLEGADYKELEHLLQQGLCESSVPERIQIILLWFKVDQTGRFEGAKTLLMRNVQRSSLGVFRFMETATTVEEMLLLRPLVTLSKTTLSLPAASQETVFHLSVVPTRTGDDPSVVKGYTLSMCAYFRATNEWLCLSDSFFPESSFPDFVTRCYNRQLSPLSINEDRIIFTFENPDHCDGNTTSGCVMIYNFRIKQLTFHCTFLGRIPSYAFADGLIVAAAYRQKDRKGGSINIFELSGELREKDKEGDDLEVAEVSGESWKLVVQIPVTTEGGLHRTEELRHVGLCIAPDLTRIIIQVKELTNCTTKSTILFRLIGHRVNLDKTISPLDDCPLAFFKYASLIANITTVLSCSKIHIMFENIQGKCLRSCIYNTQTNEWQVLEDPQALLRNDVIKGICQQYPVCYPSQSCIATVFAPTAMYQISRDTNRAGNFQCEVKRLDLESGSIEELPPTPYMHFGASVSYPRNSLLCQGFCGGVINTDSIAKLVRTSNTMVDAALQCLAASKKQNHVIKSYQLPAGNMGTNYTCEQKREVVIEKSLFPAPVLEYQPMAVRPLLEDTTGKKLLEQTKSGDCCDVRLVYKNHALWAHSSVLVLKSEYFTSLLRNKMFLPVDKNNIDLTDIFTTERLAKAVHTFFYLSTITITPRNFRDVLQSAKFLQMEGLAFAVEQFLINNLTSANGISLFCFAKRSRFQNLVQLSAALMRGPAAIKFSNAKRTQQASVEKMDCIFDIGIDASSSVQELIHIFITWFQADPGARYEPAKKLLNKIKGSTCLLGGMIKEAANEETRSLLRSLLPLCPASTSNTTLQESILYVGFVSTDELGFSPSLNKLNEFLLCTSVYVRSTNEWIDLSDASFSFSAFPELMSGTEIMPLAVTGELLVFVMRRKRKEQDLFILTLKSGKTELKSIELGSNVKYTFSSGVIVAAGFEHDETSIKLSGQNQDMKLKVFDMDPAGEAMCRSVADIDIAKSDFPTLRKSQMVKATHVFVAPDRSIYVLQVRQDRSATYSMHWTGFIAGLKIKHSDNSLSFISQSMEFPFPLGALVKTGQSSSQFYVFFSSADGNGDVVYNFATDDWKLSRGVKAAKTVLLNLLPNPQGSGHVVSRSISEVSSPGAQFRIVEDVNNFTCQIGRYDLERGEAELLPPTAFINYMSCLESQHQVRCSYGYCAGFIDINALSSGISSGSILRKNVISRLSRKRGETTHLNEELRVMSYMYM